MIVTVTPNPSIDRTVTVDALRRGGVHRTRSVRIEPSGKGVNVTHAVRLAGQESRAILPVGGPTGVELVALLDALAIPYVRVPMTGAVRINTSVLEDDGTTTKFNEAGPELFAAQADALVGAALGHGRSAEWVAWCGSLPGGFGADRLAGAIAAGRADGTRIALDTSGAALAHVLQGPPDALPHLVTPNADELADLVGRPLRSLGDVVDAARDLLGRGLRTVLVSLGADGALLVEVDTVLHGVAPVPRVVNTAGAGDALLAGYLAADGLTTQDQLASALRFGAAAVQEPGTLLHTVDTSVPVEIGPARHDHPLPAGG